MVRIIIIYTSIKCQPPKSQSKICDNVNNNTSTTKINLLINALCFRNLSDKSKLLANIFSSFLQAAPESDQNVYDYDFI